MSVEVRADIPGASIGRSQVMADDVVSIEVQSSLEYGLEGSLETWVCGRLVDSTVASVEVHVVNEHGNMAYLRPVVDDGTGTYVHVSSFGQAEDETGHTYFRFQVPTPGPSSAFATWWPYGVDRYEQLLADLGDLSFVHLEEIGRSVRGRPLHAFVIGGDAQTPVLALTSGMHGGEPSALHAVDALLRHFCSAHCEDARRKVRIAAIPLVNIDAQADGLDRRSASGANLWLDEGADQEPEIQATIERLREAEPAVYLDLHSWHWGGDGCFQPGWLAAGESLYDRILRLRRCIDDVFPLSPQIFMSDELTTWLTRACVELGVPALGPEISLGRGTDGQWKTLGQAQRDGASILRGAFTYLGIA